MVKSWLREHGAAKLFDLKPTREAELTRQRLRFAPRLMSSVGLLPAGAFFWTKSSSSAAIRRCNAAGATPSWRVGSAGTKWTACRGSRRSPHSPTISWRRCSIDRRDEELIPQTLEQKGLTRQAVLAKTVHGGIATHARRPACAARRVRLARRPKPYRRSLLRRLPVASFRPRDRRAPGGKVDAPIHQVVDHRMGYRAPLRRTNDDRGRNDPDRLHRERRIGTGRPRR